MDNKQQIQKLRNNAELAWASYGYFHCVGYKFDINDDRVVTLENILDITYKNFKIVDEKGFRIATLKGEFTPTQAKRFSERYELIHHIPNTTISGFSATLFYDTSQKDYILSFRGTELGAKDIMTDTFLAIYPTTAINQILSLDKLLQEILQKAKNHQEQLTHTTDNANTNSCVDSHNTATSHQDIVDYCVKPNLKFILTGHSLGGHLAQVFCLHYPLIAKELYTYNAPGLGGIITSAMVIFLRVLRVIWKLLVKLVRSVAKLFNPNGFTRKVLDKSLKASGYEGDTDNAIRLMESHKDTEIFETLGMSAKKARRGENLGIEIHHIESIRAAIQNDDSLKSNWQQFYEPTTSAISDLGIKLGLTLDEKLDYRNTEALHLINVAKHTHSVTHTAQTLYFYSYLLSYQTNADKYQAYTIAQTLDSLNEFVECLQRLLKPTKQVVTKTRRLDTNTTLDSNPILVLVGNLWYVYTMLHSDEFINNQGFIVDSTTFVETLYKLTDKRYAIKMLDKQDIERIDIHTCTIAQKRVLCQLEPFIFIDDSNNECLNANNYAKIYRHNSSSTQIVSAKENDTYWNIRKRDMIGFHFDKNVVVALLA